ncbi:MAG: hypothetical protein KIT44_07960 [Opitutaceae bacterium]|nr:hypothetical protein [Opitutaceae bacterium]
MAGPLTLLGQALAGGARDYMQLRVRERDEQRRRQQQLEDEERRRTQQLEDRDSNREYELQLYNQRRLDAIVNELVRSGRLAPEDMNNPSAVDAALKRNGVQSALDTEELAGYKASIAELTKQVGNIEGIGKILDMTPEQLPEARTIMARAYQALGSRVEEDRKRGLDNARNGAALLQANMARISGVESQLANVMAEVERLQAGEFSDDELAQARSLALAARPDLAKKKKLSPGDLAELRAEEDKQAAAIAFGKMESLGQRARSLQRQQQDTHRQFDNIASNMRSGAYAFLPVGEPAEAPPPPLPASQPAEPEPESPAPSPESFINELQSGNPLNAAPPAAPSAPSPAPLGVEPIPAPPPMSPADSVRAGRAARDREGLVAQIARLNMAIQKEEADALPQANIFGQPLSEPFPELRARGLANLKARRDALQSQLTQFN